MIDKISSQFKGAVCKNNPIDIAKAGSLQTWSIPYIVNAFSLRLGSAERLAADPAAAGLPFSLQQQVQN